MSTQHQRFSRHERVEIGSVGLIMALVLGALVMLPATAAGQTTGTQTPGTTMVPTASLTLSTSSGPPGATITANGSGFKADEIVDVSFNGQMVGQPKADGNGGFALSFKAPNLPHGDYGVLAKGQASGASASAAFEIKPGAATLSFSLPEAAPGVSLTATAAGFQPGETVQLTFNGPLVGSATADTTGSVSVAFSVPTLAAGQYGVTATGQTSGTTVNEQYTVLASPTPVPTTAPAPTATPAPVIAPVPAPIAPAMVHDERYFSQTGYRIESDEAWSFFQQYGGLPTFGYPVSRNMLFLGCPVQMFQRHIIQVCPGQGAQLMNLLDPEIFPYTRVNGSQFPAPDATLKANTPQTNSPTYSEDITRFVEATVPNTFGGQPVGFLDRFNNFGGLVIWGAPISTPQPDPSNGNFIYLRFQRGIMHFIVGSGTESILLADYLKGILMNQNVPADLTAQARGTGYFSQYCPGESHWLCRPNDQPGTDLTFAFTQG